jgi:hypothetical protein
MTDCNVFAVNTLRQRPRVTGRVNIFPNVIPACPESFLRSQRALGEGFPTSGNDRKEELRQRSADVIFLKMPSLSENKLP